MKRQFTILAFFASLFLWFPISGRMVQTVSSSGLESLALPIDSAIPAMPPDEVRVLSYNVFMRPEPISNADHTLERAALIGQWIEGAEVDIVALQEAWEPGAISLLLEAVADEFPYYASDRPVRKFGKIVSGGLLILSRWPIEEVQTVVYDSCHLADCLAAKGATHALIRIAEDAYLNLVVTHLDAGSAARDRQVRAMQIEQLRQFLEGIDRQAGPLLIAGDFNIDSHAEDGEYKMLTATLNIETHSPPDASTVNCELEASIFCETPVPAKQIDYIFTTTGDGRLLPGETQIFPHVTDAIDGEVKYLSDHRAVWGTFEISLP